MLYSDHSMEQMKKRADVPPLSDFPDPLVLDVHYSVVLEVHLTFVTVLKSKRAGISHKNQNKAKTFSLKCMMT